MQHPRPSAAAAFAAAIASLAWLAPSAASARSVDLPERPLAVIRQQLVPDAAVSVVVRDVQSGESYVEMNASTPRVPASTLKLVPTFAALDLLGPAYTWPTRAWHDGTLAGGVLKGNLYLQGGGDPLMTIERWWRFVSDLRQTGLKAIEGDIVVDRSIFAPLDELPGDFDGKGWRPYNVLPDGLLINLQSAEFIIRPGIDGEGVDIEVDPQPANLVMENRARLVGGRCRAAAGNVYINNARDNPNRIVVTGTLSRNCPPQIVRRAIMEPAEFAYGTFVMLWRQQGGQVRGGLRQAVTPIDARFLLKQDSLTMAEIVRATNKYSSNVMARTLVLTLAAEKAGRPATHQSGDRVIDQWLKARGLEFPELVVDNGSGLSREARISADSMARLLIAADRSSFAPEFESSLALGGLDGTLRTRFEALPNPSRIRMKTGTLRDVSALAGYVTADSGRKFAVVILVNHAGAQDGPGEAIQQAVVKWVLSQ